jgi:hypothetical protein
MGSGRRAHDLKAVPLPAAQGAIGTWAPSETCGRLPRRAQTIKLQDLVHQNVKGPFQAPSHFGDRNRIALADTIQPS